MSVWRDIWQKALIAQRRMLQKGDFSEFDKVISEYSEDGMVNYVLAETYEITNDFDKAVEQFKLAQERLPVPHWKEVAQIGIDRCITKKEKGRYSPDKDFKSIKWSYFHRFHGLVYLPEKDVRYPAISAISKLDSEPKECFVTFRKCMEISIKRLVLQDVSLSETDDLVVLQKAYCDAYPEAKQLNHDFNAIRIMGNDAIHDHPIEMNEENTLNVLRSFFKIMTQLNKDLEQIDKYKTE